MRRTVLCLGVLLFAAGANAQWRPYDNDGGYHRDDDYGRRRGGPRGDVIERVLRDVDAAQSWGYRDHHARKRFEQIRKDLYRFQHNWERGRFDKDRLDSAIENLHHLVDSDRVDPRGRGMLERDMWDLRSFRENGGYYRGYRDGPRW